MKRREKPLYFELSLLNGNKLLFIRNHQYIEHNTHTHTPSHVEQMGIWWRQPQCYTERHFMRAMCVFVCIIVQFISHIYTEHSAQCISHSYVVGRIFNFKLNSLQHHFFLLIVVLYNI